MDIFPLFHNIKYDISIFLIIKVIVHVLSNDLLMKQMLPDSQHSNYFSIATCVEIYKGTEFFHKLKFSDITLSLQPYSIHL